RGFSSRTTIPEQLPVGAPDVNFNSAAALVITVIPFQQVAIDLGNVPEAGQFACSGRARQRTGEHFGEGVATQPLCETAGVVFTTLGQRQIGESRMLARQAPGGFAMSGRVNNRQRSAHDALLVANLFDSP